MDPLSRRMLEMTACSSEERLEHRRRRRCDMGVGFAGGGMEGLGMGNVETESGLWEQEEATWW